MTRAPLTDLSPNTLGDRLVGYTCWIVGICMLLWALSDRANAYEVDKRHDQASYVKALEAIVSACLSDATGRAVRIGETMFLCGIQEIGSWK